MSVPWHTFQLGRVLSSVPPGRILPTPARLPQPPRCARRSTSTAAGSRTRWRGRRSAAMADDADAAPHSDSSDHVPNGGMPNGGAVPEGDGPAAASSSASGASTLSSDNPILVLCRLYSASVPHPREGSLCRHRTCEQVMTS